VVDQGSRTMYTEACMSSPGRVCFVGENLDWITGQVIPCAISDLRTYVLVNPGSSSETIVNSYHPYHVSDRFDVHETIGYKDGPLNYVRAVFNALRDDGIQLENVHVEIASTLPVSAGLSSSASLCVSLVGALNEACALELPIEKVCDLAYHAEARCLATGCGQMDQYSCGLGGLLLLDCVTEPPQTIERLQVRDDVSIVIGDTQLKRRTGDIISEIRQRLLQRDPLIREYVERTQHALDEMCGLLREPDWEPWAVGRLLTACHTYLRDYEQVSNRMLEGYIDASLRAGAFGAKISGAGRGGCMFALAGREDAAAVSEAIREAGGVAHVTGIARLGLTAENAAVFRSL